jgi:hypothetical protein
MMPSGGAEGDCERAEQTDETVCQRVVAMMEELRGQGYNFRDIAAVLERQGLTLSPERIKEILEARYARKPKE